MRRGWMVAAALCGLAGAIAPAGAADRTERVRFAKGASSAALKGRIAGDQGVAYVVGAQAGQTLSVTLTTSNPSNYFNVVVPGADEALFVGSTSGGMFRGTLPVAGDYRIQVYLMRNAARRGEVARYTLEVAVTGAPSAAQDAKVPGTKYQATASIGCALRAGAPMGQCAAGVMRFGGGEATVEIALPGGQQRHIYFQGRQATGSDSRVVGFVARKKDDLNIITVAGQERYEFPDAFVLGD